MMVGMVPLLLESFTYPFNETVVILEFLKSQNTGAIGWQTFWWMRRPYEPDPQVCTQMRMLTFSRDVLDLNIALQLCNMLI